MPLQLVELQGLSEFDSLFQFTLLLTYKRLLITIIGEPQMLINKNGYSS